MCFDKIRSRFKNAKLLVCTNGTIYNTELAETFYDKYVHVTISHDGLDQEAFRGQKELVELNIKKYQQILLPEKIAARLTFLKSNISNLHESVVYIYEKLGIHNISHAPAMDSTWTLEDCYLYGAQLSRVAQYKRSHPTLNYYVCDQKRLVSPKKVNTKACGAGNLIVAVDAEGGLFPCHRLVSVPESKIGDVRGRFLARGAFLTMDMQCRGCNASSLCLGCIAVNYKLTGSFTQPISQMCEMTQQEYNAILNHRGAPGDEVLKTLNSMLVVLQDVRDSNETILKIVKAPVIV
jgi:uncharacterized protein